MKLCVMEWGCSRVAESMPSTYKGNALDQLNTIPWWEKFLSFAFPEGDCTKLMSVLSTWGRIP